VSTFIQIVYLFTKKFILDKLAHIRLLLKKVDNNSATQEDINELITWINSQEGLENSLWICEQLGISEDLLQNDASAVATHSNIVDRILEMDKQTHRLLAVQNKRIRINRRMKYMAAAAMLCVALGAVFFTFRGNFQSKKVQPTVAIHQSSPIVPGGNRAVLTLSNGTKVLLDSANTGLVTNENGVKVEKLTNGQLAYNATNVTAQQVAYNTLSTPRGGQYKISLPDGTQVWLNAASEITYPTVFVGNRREVTIKGEAYFEVAKNPSKPFIVKADNNMQVEVLGTHFDVNAYSDDNMIKTTLLEGSVKVSNASETKMLQPGEQMQMNKNGILKVVKDIDVESVVAWQEGIFNFNEADIITIMKQLSRWYNVDVVYEGAIPKDIFTAIISKNNNINQVLHMLETTLRVHFKVQNKTIYVSE